MRLAGVGYYTNWFGRLVDVNDGRVRAEVVASGSSVRNSTICGSGGGSSRC